MRMISFSTLALFSLAACGPDETISGYADTEALYHLISIDEVPFTARATIAFPEMGVATGHGPCNSYSATQNTFYPWFELGPINATRSACAELEMESQFFAALQNMTFSEVSGDVVLLTGEGGREMTFMAR